MAKPSIPAKHPREMTSEETLNHLFHPKIVEKVKEIVANNNKPKEKKATK